MCALSDMQHNNAEYSFPKTPVLKEFYCNEVFKGLTQCSLWATKGLYSLLELLVPKFCKLYLQVHQWMTHKNSSMIFEKTH